MPCGTVRLCGISSRFQLLSPCTGQVAHALLTRPPLSLRGFLPGGTPPRSFVRLACVRHAASVHPEPGSNSHVLVCPLGWKCWFCIFLPAVLLPSCPFTLVGSRPSHGSPRNGLPSEILFIEVFLFFFLEFSGLFYYSVIKLLLADTSLLSACRRLFPALRFPSVSLASARYILSQLADCVNTFFYFFPF